MLTDIVPGPRAPATPKPLASYDPLTIIIIQYSAVRWSLRSRHAGSEWVFSAHLLSPGQWGQPTSQIR